MFEQFKRIPKVHDLNHEIALANAKKIVVHLRTQYVTFELEAQTTADLYLAVDARIKKCDTKRGSLYRKRFVIAPTYTLFFGIKPLSRAPVALQEYTNSHMTITMQYFGLQGGYQLYTHIKECEEMVLTDVSLQAVDATVFHFSHAVTKIMTDMKKQGWDVDYITKLIEDVCFLIRMLCDATDMGGYTFAIMTFVKFQTPDSCVLSHKNITRMTEFFKELFEADFTLQSADGIFSTARLYLNKYEELKNAPIFKKLYKFAMYALSTSIFEKVGLTFDNLRYSKLEAEAIKRKYHMGLDFWHCMAETILFVCERGWQCMKTGSLDPIYHSGSQYEAWYDDVVKIKMRFRSLQQNTNPKDRFEIIADLRDLIDKGEAIKKHALRIGLHEKSAIIGIVGDLHMLLADETTKRAAQQERKAPFSVLLYGGSSIGKSTLTKMLFYQYGKTFDLPLGSEFKFTRNANANFWDGFNSSQWCVQLDDIAFKHPNKASNGDETIMEMLQVVNNVPFVPDQADISDKGRTPMRAELVIATTNCEDLNAYHYFQTPLAVQRRLPFVIDAKPKPEYTKDACMLDSGKVSTMEGYWPDYWIFTIKRVVPVGTERNRQQGELELVHTYDNVDDFLAWFSREAIKHDNIQKIVDTCDTSMSNITVCKTCWRNSLVCECAVEVEAQSTDIVNQCKTGGAYLYDMIRCLLTACFIKLLIRFGGVAGSMLQYQCIADAVYASTIPDEERRLAIRAQLGVLGNRVEKDIGRVRLLAGISATVVGFLAIRKVVTLFQTPSLSTQGGVSSTVGQAPEPKGEPENVWFRDDFELTQFNVSSKSLSWNNLEFTNVVSTLARNCVHITTHRSVEGQQVRRMVRATCLGGHVYICNNHGLPEGQTLQAEIVTGLNHMGVNGNMNVTLSQDEIYRFPEHDMALVRLRFLPPGKDITTLFPTTTLGGTHKGSYVGRHLNGSVYTKNVHNIKTTTSIKVGGTVLPTTLWSGKVEEPTAIGDCGSLLVSNTAMGPVIIGMHVVGGGDVVASLPMTQQLINDALKCIKEPMVQSNAPVLSAPGYERNLQELHPKSVARYLETGTANVYGSFSGFKQAPKSHVAPSIIAPALESEGIPIKHYAPVMKGYAPWRTAVKDMVQPVCGIDTGILAQCVEHYTKDILSNLASDALDDVFVYDNNTVVNGVAGLKYVDKMNRNTSAGCPFKKGKKYFLTPDLESGVDHVKFDPLIMDRVEDILAKYMNGERYAPVFCGHLKDEAVTEKKVRLSKTRVFTGAPCDWSFVVRKYLLSVIRLLQKNRTAWEGAPGVNAMSSEWHELHTYLTQFGSERMIAGDYAAFDKTMPPTVILAAYDVIRNICAAAGYSESELRIVQCIAEDTAFPMVDFNGDLMEFYGSNPSGHPLTVIINGLANALYMRYCYTVLNPMKECASFKNNVALMTYGDDNVMGVSDRTPWFNHTSIASTLAAVGITYTMADKEAPSVPYINMGEVSFLKRTWRFEDELGVYVCPLEEDSITKSLTIGVVSKTITPEAHAIETMSSANREYFFYGRSYFEDRQAMMKRIVDVCGLHLYVEDNTFLTWEELKQQFH